MVAISFIPHLPESSGSQSLPPRQLQFITSTMSQISFFKASQRLHSDASHLASDGQGNRRLNAGHLFGLAAECGLKYLLLLCGGLQRDPATGDLIGKKPHIDQLTAPSGLAQNYQQLVAGHTHSQYFALIPNLPALNSWKAHFRYYDETDASYPQADESGWQNASKEIQTVLDAAILDGHPIY